MANLKFGVVGVGGQGGGWTRKLNECESTDLVGVCDIRKGHIKKFAKDHNIPFWTDDYEQLLQQDLDVVVIATPHYLHAPFTIKAAQNDINVFCEKPMATTIKECDDMIRAATQNDVKLGFGFQYRFNKNYIMMKEAIEKGLLGDIFQVNMFVRWYRTELYYEMSNQHWRGRWSTEGGGALINQSVHSIDIFQWLGGEIKDISASAHIVKHEFQETEDNVGALLNFKNGAIGLLQAGVAYEFDNGTDEIGVYGTEGTMRLVGGVLEDKRQGKNKKVPLAENVEKGKPNPLMANFIRAIEEDDADIISVDGEEGKKSIELIRGIYMSIINNARVSFPVADNGTFPTLGKYYKSGMF
ncbi:MAG: hypothetical protein GF364_17525 [Candidatus Lokiarchaeota archaeon]|nr:hypothetical protein [Candidatus Lokiarchaeota archaeon]